MTFSNPPTGELTAILGSWTSASRADRDRVFEALYFEIKQRARHTPAVDAQRLLLEPTALVNEAYIKLLGSEEPIAGRAHFLALAAKAMRHIVIDRIREVAAAKRGAGQVVPLTTDVGGELCTYSSALDFDRALTELAEHQPTFAHIVEVRVFGGLSVDETAQALEISPATVKRRWTAAQSWLADRLSGGANDS